MIILPNVENVVIPIEKFTEYALHPIKGRGKAYAFEQALGYNLSNYGKLIKNIKTNLNKFDVKFKGDNGFGLKFEVLMRLTGENRKTANVITSWIVVRGGEETRLTSAYITNREVIK
jgi:Lhr-like helicase